MILAEQNKQIETTLQDGISVKIPEITCNSGNRIQRFCSNEACLQTTSCCSEDDCKGCQSRHKYCSYIELKRLKKIVEERVNYGKKIILDIFKIQDDLIGQLIASRQALLQKLRVWKPEQNRSNTINSIFFQVNTDGLKGKQIKQLLTQLSNKSKDIEAEYLKPFKQVLETKVGNIISLRENLFGQLKKQHSQVLVDSKILINDEKGREKIDYLLKQLQYPSKLKLLFRASQHHFSSNKFHQLCDGIPDTIVIVRTEFNKTIAAFTPIKWQKLNYVSTFPDLSRRSFLLQLELKEKMTLIQGLEAICNYTYGPSFGQRDLQISDKCNQAGSYTYSNFPSSYNCDGKYKRNSQESIAAFCGSEKGKNFRVLEYEVFQVIYQ